MSRGPECPGNPNQNDTIGLGPHYSLFMGLQGSCYACAFLGSSPDRYMFETFFTILFLFTLQETKWTVNVRDIIYRLALNNIWGQKIIRSVACLKTLVKRRLSDRFYQNWQSEISKSKKGLTNRITARKTLLS